LKSNFNAAAHQCAYIAYEERVITEFITKIESIGTAAREEKEERVSNIGTTAREMKKKTGWLGGQAMKLKS
jgi:hypothetical protein